MRRFTPFLLAALMAAFAGVVAMRRDDSAAATANMPAPVAASTTAAEHKPPPPALARPMRTVALGWELVAPGIVEGTGFKTKGVDATFTNASTVEEVESALAKGGADATGADLAVMPLSSFVASYERLRALAPEIVFVVGWSRGREAVYGTSPTALAKLPATGTVKVAGAPGKPETLLALFMLDLAGMPLSRVELVPPGTSAPLVAVNRGTKPPAGKLLLTSADTPYLMPLVAVAPHGFVTSHARDLEAWTRAWLDGVSALQADVPAGGRLVAQQTGAPPVVSIIEALGQVEFANLRENAVAAGLAGRGALTLADSFQTTWRIFREAGVLTTPAPDVAPLEPTAIASLARTDRAVAEQPARTPTVGTAAAGQTPVLMIVRGPETADADAWIARIGFAAAVFDRMQLRISIKGNAKLAQQVVASARDRFNLRVDHVIASPSAMTSAIEVRRAP